MRYKYFFIYFKLNSKYFAEFIPIYIKCIMNIINNHMNIINNHMNIKKNNKN